MGGPMGCMRGEAPWESHRPLIKVPKLLPSCSVGFPCWNVPDGARSADSVTLFLFRPVEGKGPGSPSPALLPQPDQDGVDLGLLSSQPWESRKGLGEQAASTSRVLTKPRPSWPTGMGGWDQVTVSLP